MQETISKEDLLTQITSTERYGYDVIADSIESCETIGDLIGNLESTINTIRFAIDQMNNSTDFDSDTEIK